MYLYLNLITLLSFAALISAIGGFLIYLAFQKMSLPKILGGAFGALATTVFIYLILSFFDFGFYDTAFIGLAILIFVLFLLHVNGIFNIAWAGIIVVAIMFIGNLILFIATSQKGADETYLLPEGFEGCVVINYEVQGAPPLELKNDEIVYHVPEDGVINTSSPLELGWVNKDYSGPNREKAFYVDKQGNQIKELPQEQIHSGMTGSTTWHENQPERIQQYVLFGSEDMASQGCPAADSSP